MSFDNFKRVLFNDGEGITFGDLNDAQSFLASRVFDGVIAKTTGSDPTLNNATDPDAPGQFNVAHAYWAYALSVRGGQPIPGSANNKVKFSPGTVFQATAADTGNETVFLAYTFLGTEEFTIANGSGSGNNRIDIIQMQLAHVSDDLQSRDFEDATTRIVTSTSMSTKRRIQATINVKTGTPAAIPTFPNPDAGFCVLASVYVPSAYAAAGAMGYGTFDDPAGSATLHDQRMPLRVRPFTIYAKDALYNSSIWIATNGSSSPATSGPRSLKCNTNTTGIDNNVNMICPKTVGRVVGISITSRNFLSTAQSARIGDIVEPDGFGNAIDLASLLETGSVMKTHFGGINILENFNTSSVLRSSQGIGMPLWANGYPREPEYFKNGSGNINHFDHLYIQFQPHSTAEVQNVTLWIAEGW